MKTYYPLRAAADFAGVSKRTMYRWIDRGLHTEEYGRIRLQKVDIASRGTCIEETHLKAFVAARDRQLVFQARLHEKFIH